MTAADSIHDFLDAMTPHVPRYVRNTRVHETLKGEGDFWARNGWERAGDGPKYDNEQYMDVFVAVQRACQFIGSPADRWAIVELEITRLANIYGESK
jgi:hypothetical protein